MGEAETPLVAKERAAEQAMRAAAEQAGVYLESLTEVQNMRLVRDEITVLTATVLAVVDKKYSQRSVDTGGMHFTCPSPPGWTPAMSKKCKTAHGIGKSRIH